MGKILILKSCRTKLNATSSGVIIPGFDDKPAIPDTPGGADTPDTPSDPETPKYDAIYYHTNAKWFKDRQTALDAGTVTGVFFLFNRGSASKLSVTIESFDGWYVRCCNFAVEHSEDLITGATNMRPVRATSAVNSGSVTHSAEGDTHSLWAGVHSQADETAGALTLEQILEIEAKAPLHIIATLTP